MSLQERVILSSSIQRVAKDHGSCGPCAQLRTNCLHDLTNTSCSQHQFEFRETQYLVANLIMNPSPLRSLISRHVCTCRNATPFRATQKSTSIRPFSSVLARRRYEAASLPPTFGGAELLKRKNQPFTFSKQKSHEEKARELKRIRTLFMLWTLTGMCMGGAVYFYREELESAKSNKKESPEKQNITSCDAPPTFPGITPPDASEVIEQVPTGTSTIPTFPKTIYLSGPSSTSAPSSLSIDNQEYQLVGLGIRTVSFLGIQVYVVGMYIALSDISILQESLIRTLDPVATTLVPGEKSKLKELLLDPERSEEIWNTILKDGKIRTALRIVPTRNTDFMHLRDGWVRGITNKTQKSSVIKEDPVFSDETFGQAVNDFKAIWGGGARKNVPKGETLLLKRNAKGTMEAWYEDKDGALKLGEVRDERVSRLIWLGYLGGKTVSSEGARHSIVDGCMDYVERPVGTVATQVI